MPLKLNIVRKLPSTSSVDISPISVASNNISSMDIMNTTHSESVLVQNNNTTLIGTSLHVPTSFGQSYINSIPFEVKTTISHTPSVEMSLQVGTNLETSDTNVINRSPLRLKIKHINNVTLSLSVTSDTIVVADKCWKDSCNTKALRYGIPGRTVDSCGRHKGKDRVEIFSTTCKDSHCNKQPVFNILGSKVGLYCKDHKLSGMIDVKHEKCEFCKKRPTFNYEGEIKAVRCSYHKDPRMINVIKTRRCELCAKIPSFNYEGEIKGVRCGDHRESMMVDVKHSRCEFCKKRPTFNYEGEIKAVRCGDHKESKMVDVLNSRCALCTKQPAFNYEGEIKAVRCSDHKNPGMIDVKSKRCEFCRKIPVFNYEGESKGIRCKDHKEPDMVDFKGSTCDFCRKHPAFNYEGEIKGVRCKDHKEPGMVNVICRRCEFCTKQPSFNYEGEIKGIRCRDHKDPDMIDVISKKCEFCTRQPTFNYEGKIKAVRCKDHKEPGMVNVVTRRCKDPGCSIRARCGLPGNKPTRCTRHASVGMISYPRRLCVSKDCRDIALFGEITHQFCEAHSTPDMHNFVERECISCHLPNILNYSMKCSSCDDTHFKRIRMFKQNKVKDMLTVREFQIDSYDRIIEESCDRERPDFVFRGNRHVVILEVDENQHGGYVSECERIRMINIFYSFGGMKVIFIRYNPDTFKKNSVKQEVSDNRRHDILTRWLRYLIEMEIEDRNDNFLQAIYLYYDEFDETNVELRKISADGYCDEEFENHNNYDSEHSDDEEVYNGKCEDCN